MSDKNEDPGVVASETDSPSPGLLRKDFNRLLREIRQLAHDHIELLTLEARLSVNILLQMAVISLITALLLVSGWLALVGSAALGLISVGLPPALALLVVAMSNLLVAIYGPVRIRKLSNWLGWPATLRSIKPSAESEDPRGDA